jgi:2-polyprenyl-3-methyl-5-hydroxy-6-metoxy-1,4-benzoquinol methylase
MSAHKGPVLARREGYAVIDCERCGWAHLDPLPDEAELALMYERDYYQELNPGWLEKDRSEQAFWDLEHADKLADWRAILGRQTGALLDVGCSGGLLLEYVVAQGWRVEGIEPSAPPVAEARERGLTIHAGLYQDVELPAESFDVVHCKLVAEHLPDPPDFLAWAARLLRPGGIVTLHVPNDFNPVQLAARDALELEDWWVAPPFHLNYFTFASLEGLLSSCGFTPVIRDTTFPMEWFLLMGENYVEDAELGASAHRRRMLLESRLEALGQRRTLHRHLASEGTGREAIVHGRLCG